MAKLTHVSLLQVSSPSTVGLLYDIIARYRDTTQYKTNSKVLIAHLRQQTSEGIMINEHPKLEMMFGIRYNEMMGHEQSIQ